VARWRELDDGHAPVRPRRARTRRCRDGSSRGWSGATRNDTARGVDVSGSLAPARPRTTFGREACPAGVDVSGRSRPGSLAKRRPHGRRRRWCRAAPRAPRPEPGGRRRRPRTASPRRRRRAPRHDTSTRSRSGAPSAAHSILRVQPTRSVATCRRASPVHRIGVDSEQRTMRVDVLCNAPRQPTRHRGPRTSQRLEVPAGANRCRRSR